ncbi:PucR family transcriptional regulator [Leifsonia sp. NPDC058194]|uniref:PucR family transcriptional regulator n=1 Tax=Leifsonia sp. NPDC058194 TaxID=3346374 RepID=UPI0036DBCA8C
MITDETDRPEPVSTVVLPTVREILRFDEVAAALPEVLSGEDALENPVRWVHVSETASSARLVSGGELLLSTGVGWPADDAGLRALAEQLAGGGIAGFVLELGERMPAAPAALVDGFRAAGLPFVVLHREVRFIAITEAVHSRIIADQMGALRARDEIHALFTELSLRGSPADFIVAQAARALDAPVVLEDLNHRVIAVSGIDGDEQALRDWEQRSRQEHRGTGGERWLITPIEARGMRWGHLVALPGRPHPAGRSNVLEQAAVALALSRLADRDADEWTRQSHDRLLGALLGRRFATESGLVARFEASGLPVAGRALSGVAIGVHALAGQVPDMAALVAGASAEARDQGVDALVSQHPDRASGMLVLAISSRPERSVTDATLAAIGGAVARAAAATAGSGGAVTVALGSEAPGIPGLLASVAEAGQLLARADPRRSQGVTVLRAQHRPLLRLVTTLGADPRMQEHSELMLRPLIDYDLANSGDLLEVLRAYASHPGNRTKAAAASHLSRSVFYQRIALIEELLGMDLDDGETLSALHAALLARSARG